MKEHRTRIKRKKTREHVLWIGMNSRVNQRRGKYANCSVSENFKDFQFFAKWCKEQIGWDDEEQFHLDKDFLIEGNTIYGENTCCLLPRVINTIFATSGRGEDTGAVYLSQSNLWQARCSEFGVQKYYGTYSTKEEAIAVYRQKKLEYINKVAEAYKGRVRREVHEKLVNFKF